MWYVYLQGILPDGIADASFECAFLWYVQAQSQQSICEDSVLYLNMEAEIVAVRVLMFSACCEKVRQILLHRPYEGCRYGLPFEVSVGFDVAGGPKATLYFKNGRCRMEQGCSNCDVKLPFSSCEKFNGLIDGTTTPIPSKGFHHIGFLLNSFTKLTDLLSKYMRPDPEDLKDPDFFRISTLLLLNTITVAIAQIGNNDEIGKFSASNMVDGEISFSIKGAASTTIRVKDHRLLGIKKASDNPRARRLYDRLGFRESGIVSRWWKIL